MPQYLVSVWHDETFETDFSTPDACSATSITGTSLSTGELLCESNYDSGQARTIWSS